MIGNFIALENLTTSPFHTLIQSCSGQLATVVFFRSVLERYVGSSPVPAGMVSRRNALTTKVFFRTIGSARQETTSL